MKKANITRIVFLAIVMMLWIVPQGWSGVLNPPVNFDQFYKAKAPYDDPQPIYVNLNWKKFLSQEEVAKLLVDVEASKEAWAEVIGFKAPDIVGKIAPEIKPGIYNYKDKDKYPGLKELMLPYHYEKFKPGGPPFPGNFQQIKIIPTRQYYVPPAYSQLTAKNMGKTKQDSQGYLLWQTYDGGLPWPRPSGPHNAMQILYDYKYCLSGPDSYMILGGTHGYTKDLKKDFEGRNIGGWLITQGRIMPPLGWYDERAKERGEKFTSGMLFLAPKDFYGLASTGIQYIDPLKYGNTLMYIPGMRRVRKLSATDMQDVFAGSDMISDDGLGFYQQMTPKIYPYQYKVLEEREFLVQSYTIDGSWYYSSPEKGLERVNTEWERRPMYVLELTQLDKSYPYSKRIIYVDKETFLITLTMNYDQKGRLYRTMEMIHQFIPDAGIPNLGTSVIQEDYIDTHSTLMPMGLRYPYPSLTREVGDIDVWKAVK